ncbi:MAG TPA: hypothetical protein VGO62_05450 [Myxococcota bacterium]
MPGNSSKQLAFSKAGADVILLLHAAHNPSDAEWDEYLAFVKTVRVEPERLRTLVFSDGGRPSFPQRSRLAELVRGRPSRVAIVTDAASVHFISAQLSLEGPSSRTFSTNDFADASTHLALSAAQQSSVKDAAAQLLPNLAQCNSARAVLGLSEA